ncbi:hypothetical protein LCGC14_0757160 [marine sediment metagenome]|uniref:Uncharacterized protein n=1 Tax=marine sediment metagenome TaxID=412755 RepID=A0A0F9SMG6_9ZZZZ|nr:MAG: Tetratricopeptide repeat protein [Candidatus Lokiarchaeum sp. GC14_75]
MGHLDILDNLDRGLEGLQILENGLKVSPNNQELVIELTNLCFGYEKVSPLRSAFKIINDALEKEPDDIGIIMNKASLLYHLNKKDEALEQLEKAKSLQDPNDEMYARILVLMSIIYNERGNIEKAIEINRKVIISFPDHYPSNLQMRKLLKFLDLKNAIQFLESAIEHFPKEIKFIKDIADLYFKHRNYKKVDFYVEKALALNPKLKTKLKMLAYKIMIEIDVNQDMDIAINLMKMTEMKDFPEVVVFPYVNMAINSIIKEQEYEEGLKFYEISTFLLSKFKIKNKIDLNEFLDNFKKLKAWGQSKKDQALINRIDKVTQTIKKITEN